MKKIAALFTVFLTILVGFFPVSASAQTSSAKKSPYLEFTEHAAEFTVDTPLDEYAGYYLAKKLTVTKDFTLPKNTDLYIRAGGELVIKKGAGFTANGRVIVERGGCLSIQKGTFTETDWLKNFGEIKVGKNGSLILNDGGDYTSNAGSRLTQEGEILFGELRLSDLTERILKYDKNFSLDSYRIDTFGCGEMYPIANHDIFLYYCIGDIETDYYYKATNDTAHPKLTRKGYSFSRVYNVQRAEKLKRAAEKYADEHDLYRSYTDSSCFEVEIGFKYSYKTRNLNSYAYSFQAAWWDWQGEDEEEEGFYYRDNVHEEKVGRF